MPRVLRPLPALLTTLALLAFVGYFAVYLVYARALLNFPFDYDQGEGFEPRHDPDEPGQWPYRDNAVYRSTPRTTRRSITLILPSCRSPAPRTAGRLVAFWGTLFTGAAIAGIVRRELKPRAAGRGFARSACPCPLATTGPAAPAAGAWYASNYVYHIGPLLRQHMLMVMFETLAIAFVARSTAPRGQRALVAALACVLAAGYTKQLAVGTGAAVLAYVFLRGPRRGLIAGVLAALVAGAIFLALDVATGHQWYVNIIAANINEFRPEQARALRAMVPPARLPDRARARPAGTSCTGTGSRPTAAGWPPRSASPRCPGSGARASRTSSPRSPPRAVWRARAGTHVSWAAARARPAWDRGRARAAVVPRLRARGGPLPHRTGCFSRNRSAPRPAG
jgi:hypothetical protein